HRCLERVAGQFAVALCGMSVAHEQKSALLENRQVNCGSLANFVVVHVTAKDSRIPSGYHVTSGRRYSHTSEHRLKRNGYRLQRIRRLFEIGDAFLLIDLPTAAEILGAVEVHQITRHQRIADYLLAAGRPITIGAHAIQANYERVAGQRAFDKERTGKR